MDFKTIVMENKKRFLTAGALIALFIAIVIADSFFVVWFVLGTAYMISFREANKLFHVEDHGLIFYGALIWVVAAFYPYGDDLVFIIAIFFASVMAYKKEHIQQEFLPFLYPTVGFLFLLTLYVEYGINALIWLVVVVAAVDVGAFFIGKRFGKTPFSPTSPNKTLEGVFGGIIFGTVLGFFMGTAIVEPLLAFIISFAMAGSAIFGDLYESFLKREAGVKDSGDIFPGHGGMLDRVDGYLFAVIVMVVLLRGLV